MINNYVFKLLSQDSLDSTAAAQLAAVKQRANIETLTAADLPDYIFKSLKTLLGETDATNNEFGQPNWAVNRITDKRANVKFQKIESPRSLPIIYLNSSDLKPDAGANPGRYRAKLEILVHTHPESANSNQAWNILQRIHNQFIAYGPTGIPTRKNIVTAVSGITGLAELFIRHELTPVSAWDMQRAVYAVDAVLIQ